MRALDPVLKILKRELEINADDALWCWGDYVRELETALDSVYPWNQAKRSSDKKEWRDFYTKVIQDIDDIKVWRNDCAHNLTGTYNRVRATKIWKGVEALFDHLSTKLHE